MYQLDEVYHAVNSSADMVFEAGVYALLLRDGAVVGAVGPFETARDLVVHHNLIVAGSQRCEANAWQEHVVKAPFEFEVVHDAGRTDEFHE